MKNTEKFRKEMAQSPAEAKKKFLEAALQHSGLKACEKILTLLIGNKETTQRFLSSSRNGAIIEIILRHPKTEEFFMLL
jgi:hypothetical protein